MRLDAALGFDTALEDVADVARAAEAAGVSGLWTAETRHDPFLPLVPAAMATERLELGTAVAVAFARSPTAVASTAWDLARLSGGRFRLGLGTQVRAHVERRFGMPWSGRPVAQMREYVAVLRAAWTAWQDGTRPAFRGEFYRLTLMTPFFDPGPIDHP
ncbi:MAG TPA: LLM class flavin-dependent oxidoreductase, partial [Candidatus Limnocylindria bacterium]|nr:LLM class flavin-dependent oxidoreductase [Candidatus Limnocylindria bacterium]